MEAFYAFDNILIKVYNQVDDWQIICLKDNKKIKERWFSVWSDHKKESFFHAIESTCEQEFSHKLNKTDICYC